MLTHLQAAWKSNRHWLAAGFLIASTFYLLLMFLNAQNERRGLAEQRASGLGAVAGDAGWEPISLWRQRSILPSLPRRHSSGSRVYYQKGSGYIGGVVGGVPGGVPSNAVGSMQNSPAADNPARREIVRTGTLLILAPSAARTSERVRDIATRLSGFVVKSSINGSDQSARSANVVLRIPADRFDDARREIRSLATSIEDDSTEASDVTRESADQQAQLRNDRAEETQYLAIMKRAVTVKDVLEVSEKLAGIRASIDRLETEMRNLHQQVEMSLLNVGITSVAEARVLGITWRPLYEAKVSARNALAALADFTDSVVTLAFYVPVIMLWGVLVVVVLKLGWLMLSRLARVFFPDWVMWRRRVPEASPERTARG